ncbi:MULTISPECIES: hypothetical protein [unclassified Sphingomonas]|nr:MULTISPECIES: hypothetical protein [unclassified Sphingomonas]
MSDHGHLPSSWRKPGSPFFLSIAKQGEGSEIPAFAGMTRDVAQGGAA